MNIATKFTNDTNGNVTQITSTVGWGSILNDLNDAAYVLLSFNIFTGLGQALDPVSQTVVLFDIDTGKYKILDKNGVLISSGINTIFIKYGLSVPVDNKFNLSYRSKEYWDLYRAIYNEKYSLLDLFLIPLVSGNVNKSNPLTGPARNVVDTLDLLYIDSGELNILSGGTYADPMLYYDTLTRTPGQVLIFDGYNQSNTWNHAEIGFSESVPTSFIVNTLGLRLNAGGNISAMDNHRLSTGVLIGAYSTNIVGGAVLPFSSGGAILLKDTNNLWQLYYIGRASTFNTLVPGILTATREMSLSELIISDDLLPIAPQLADSYTNVLSIEDKVEQYPAEVGEVIFNSDGAHFERGTGNDYIRLYNVINSLSSMDEITMLVRFRNNTQDQDRCLIYCGPDSDNVLQISARLSETCRISCKTGGVQYATNPDIVWGEFNIAGFTLSYTQDVLRYFINGAQWGSDVNGISSATNTDFATNIASTGQSDGGYVGDISDVIIGTPIDAATFISISNKLEAGTLTVEDLETAFGVGNVYWFDLSNAYISDGSDLTGIEAGGDNIEYSSNWITYNNERYVYPIVGDEQNSGTLTIGKWYKIIATEANHFFTGCAINNTFRATAETALDVNNIVVEFNANYILDLLDNETPYVLSETTWNSGADTQHGYGLCIDYTDTVLNGVFVLVNATGSFEVVKSVNNQWTTLASGALTYDPDARLLARATKNITSGIDIWFAYGIVGSEQQIASVTVTDAILPLAKDQGVFECNGAYSIDVERNGSEATFNGVDGYISLKTDNFLNLLNTGEGTFIAKWSWNGDLVTNYERIFHISADATNYITLGLNTSRQTSFTRMANGTQKYVNGANSDNGIMIGTYSLLNDIIDIYDISSDTPTQTKTGLLAMSYADLSTGTYYIGYDGGSRYWNGTAKHCIYGADYISGATAQYLYDLIDTNTLTSSDLDTAFPSGWMWLKLNEAPGFNHNSGTFSTNENNKLKDIKVYVSDDNLQEQLNEFNYTKDNLPTLLQHQINIKNDL